jgi:site-specific recombinase XerD
VGGADVAAVTFHGAWQRYRHHLLAERQLARNTVATYRVALTEFHLSLGAKPWHKAGPRELARFLDRPRKGGAAKAGGPLSPASRATYAGAVCVFYAWAHREKLIRRDPMAGFVRPKGGRAIPRAVPLKGTDDQPGLDALLSHARGDPRLQVMVLLGCREGLRAAEIAALRIEHVWLGEGAKLRVVGGKGGRDRVVPLHPRVRAVLAAHLAGRPASGPVVESRTAPGAHISASAVSRLLGRALREAKVLTDSGTRATGHSLRHTAATNMLAAGKGRNIRAVSNFLGHANLATTQVYTLAHNQDLAESMAELAAADAKAGAL